jgi:hypothetical protein
MVSGLTKGLYGKEPAGIWEWHEIDNGAGASVEGRGVKENVKNKMMMWQYLASVAEHI